jgi:hypothetical protein
LSGKTFPSGAQQAIIAAPACNQLRCFAIALYGAHETGADLDGAERGLIGKLAATAAVAYGEVEMGELRQRIALLERQIPVDAAHISQAL